MRSPAIAMALDQEFAITVRRMMDAVSGTWRPSKARALYGSSLTTVTGWSRPSMSVFSSARAPARYTAPVGLLGEFRRMPLVRGVMAAAMRPTSSWKRSSVSTRTMRPPWFST